jgi:hypothetical protein
MNPRAPEDTVGARVARQFLMEVAVVALVSAASGSSAPDDVRERVKFQETKWVVTRSLKEVNPEVVRALKVRFGRDGRFADHGEPFEAGDVVSGKPPRRLVLAGRSGRRSFVAYEVGGRGHHLVLVVFEVGTPPQVVLLARGEAGEHDDQSDWEVDLEELREGLRTRRLYVEDPASSYY